MTVVKCYLFMVTVVEIVKNCDIDAPSDMLSFPHNYDYLGIKSLKGI